MAHLENCDKLRLAPQLLCKHLHLLRLLLQQLLFRLLSHSLQKNIIWDFAGIYL